MKKTLLGLLLLSIPCAFAQNPEMPQTTEPAKTSEIPDLSTEVQNFDQMVSEFAEKVANKEAVGLFVRTEDDKFIRIYSRFQNARGTELNSKVSKILATSGQYEGQDEVFPELGVECKKVYFKLSKDNKLAISYGQGCQKNR
jgi:hypothetical protein